MEVEYSTWRWNKTDMDKAMFKTDMIFVAVGVEIPCIVLNRCWDVKMSCIERWKRWDVWKSFLTIVEFRISFLFTQKYVYIDCNFWCIFSCLLLPFIFKILWKRVNYKISGGILVLGWNATRPIVDKVVPLLWNILSYSFMICLAYW